MHELGIVFHIIDSIEEVGRQNKLRRVSTVTVEHGKTCPFCQSPRTHLVSGNEINIKEIEAC